MTTNKNPSASPPLSNSQHSEKLKISFFKKLIFQIQEIVEQHKQKTRQSLQIKQPRLSIFLSILPFFVGFMQYIQRKYTTSVLLEKNIPAYSFPTEKVDLETLKSIKKETELSSLLKDGKIYWSETHLTSTIPQNQILNFFEIHPYITSIKSSILFNEYQKEENFQLQSEQFSQTPIHNLYEQLDELPNKIQSSFENFPSRGIEDTRLRGQLDSKNSFSPLITDKFLKNNTLKLTNNLTFFSTTNLALPSHLVKQSNLQGIQFKKLRQSRKFSGIESTKNTFPFITVRENSDKNFNALTQQFYNLFLISGDTPIFQNKKIKLNSNYFSNIEKYWGNIDDPNNLLRVLSSISQLQNNPTLFSSRIMSGYRYPDMSISQVYWHLFQQNFSFGQSSKTIQIEFPKNFSTIRKYSLTDWNPIKFLVEIQNVQIQDSENVSNLYSGPIIEISKDTGLDWNTNAKQQIQTFFQRTFSSGNPLTNSLENFFGLFYSPEYDSQNIPLNFNRNSRRRIDDSAYWFTQLPFFRNGVITNSDKGIMPFERSFQIPFISTKEWNYYLDRLKTKNNANVEKEFVEISLPILETRFSNQEKPRFFFGEKAFIDYEFFIPSNTKNVIQTDFILPTTNYLEEENFGNQLSSGVYQRLISTFSTKDSTILFSDLWEPLTFNSWLIVSQIGFAFLVFSILKALADNYGRELLVYLLDLVALLGFVDEDLKQEIEILMGQREKGFRIISKLSKTFKDIAGIEKLLPEIIEIVWFLRNSGRQFSLSKNLPRGILLTGPPGTGKTLLVQAIAGEATVPVLALSGSSLLEPGESGALKLEILFQEARKLAPCIVFIDEIDTLAEKRNQVLQNPMGADELLESLQVSSPQSKQSNLVSLGDNGTGNTEDSTADNLLTQQDTQREKLRILMQFLVELDGIQGRDGVVVLAATNRPEMLDPAILRPGRFDRVLELGLPSKEKRQEILQLYSSNLGVKETVSWNYLVNRTAGFSAADLASIMNQSSLKAITKNTQHTIETIEHGIDRITTFESEKPTQSQKNAISTLRQAYYQAGKVVTSMFLEHHPSTLVTYLWPRRKNVRALQISKNLQKYFFQYARRIELEHRIIGCYSGKAAEILFLQFSAPKNSDMNISDMGIDDIQFAQTLIQCMIEKWYLYSKEVATEKLINIADNRNLQEYATNNSKLMYFENLLQITQGNPTENAKDLANPYNVDAKDLETPLNQQTQSYFPLPWWQYQVATEFEISSRMFANWYRLYLPDPQEIEQNLEWAPPDEFYHGNSLLKDLSKSLKWNDVEGLHTSYSIHSLILQSFNEAVFLLDQNRELLDKLSFQLLKNEILREPEIQNIFEKLKRENLELIIENNPEFTNHGKSDVILSSSWGIKSRKSANQWVNFGKI